MVMVLSHSARRCFPLPLTTLSDRFPERRSLLTSSACFEANIHAEGKCSQCSQPMFGEHVEMGACSG